MLVKLETIHLPCSFKSKDEDTNVEPDFCTFNYGIPDVYGIMGYAPWSLTNGSKAC